MLAACTHAFFAGDFRGAFRQAAEISRQVHIKYTGRKYKRVVALLDEHYDELWVGGKASYKLGGIIEEGGELIIYAPHLRAISETHGRLIEKYGYAPLDRVREMVALSTELQNNLAVAAHLAHVSYAGKRDQQGDVVPRYKITMASALDEETCRRVPRVDDFAPLRRDPRIERSPIDRVRRRDTDKLSRDVVLDIDLDPVHLLEFRG